MNQQERYFNTKLPRIRSLLQTIRREVPYYQQYFQNHKVDIENLSYDEFIKLPLISKELYSKNGQQFVSDCLDLEVEGSFRHTSGSTGVPIAVYTTSRERIIVNMELMRERQAYLTTNMQELRWVGLFPTFSGIYSIIDNEYQTKVIVPNKIYGDNQGIRYLVNDDDASYRELISFLLEYKPHFILGITHVIYDFACFLTSKFPCHFDGLEAIECNSESLCEEERNKIALAFGIIPRNQYGATELKCIGYECKNNHIHLNRRTVYMETVNTQSDGTGELLLTSLVNDKTPFIRYQIGDQGKIIYDHICGCGNSEPIIELQKYRSNDCILCGNGRKIHSFIISDIINYQLKKAKTSIGRYRFVQLDYEQFELYIEQLPPQNRKDFEYCFTEAVRSLLCNRKIQIHFHYPNRIQVANAVKYKYFLNKINS